MRDERHWQRDRDGSRGPTPGQVRRARRLVLAALVLAWATQLLVTQWAAGSALAGDSALAGEVVRVRMLASAEVTGAKVRLGHVCTLEWVGAAVSRGDAGRVEDAVIAEAGAGGTVTVEIGPVLRALSSAGLKPGEIRLDGAVRCVVSLKPADPHGDEAGLMAWAGGSSADGPATRAAPPQAPAGEAEARLEVEFVEFHGETGSLGELLRHDLARRLELAPETVQLTFAPSAMESLKRTGVAVRHIRPLKADDLGEVSWTVVVEGEEMRIGAQASATVTRALAARELPGDLVIQEKDVEAQRLRIRRLADRGMEVSAAVGRRTVGPWQAGEVLTAGRLAPWMLVREGEYVSVAMVRNGVEIRVLAKALDRGAYGEVVRAISETTGQEMRVVMTGPKLGRVEEAVVRIEE
jgi:flagella basal body P-ring formation protein FlgA